MVLKKLFKGGKGSGRTEAAAGGDELTPTMKLKRRPIGEKHAATIERPPRLRVIGRAGAGRRRHDLGDRGGRVGVSHNGPEPGGRAHRGLAAGEPRGRPAEPDGAPLALDY